MTAPKNPAEWPFLFEQHVNAGDVEAAIGLYEAEAQMVPTGAESAVGVAVLTMMLEKLVSEGARFRGRVVKTIVAADIAVLHTDWEITTTGSVRESKAIEVLRRQRDGSWKLIVGEPDGREN